MKLTGNILVIDDDPALLWLYQSQLGDEGYLVATAADPKATLRWWRVNQHCCYPTGRQGNLHALAAARLRRIRKARNYRMGATSSTSLTDPEIDILVGQYVREMARYEEAARLVEDRLRRSLRANAIRALLSSRAKHPDDLRGKLARNRTDPRYGFAMLDRGMNDVVTDLAGCRIMVYRLSDVEHVARVVREALDLVTGPKAIEPHNKPSGYRATHILVRLRDNEERLSLRGAVCEVQITSLASHVFNELEHDIGYKDHGVPQTDTEQAALHEVMYAARLLDPAVERLLVERAESVRRQTVRLKDAEELQFVLEHAAGRRLHGEFARLFRLLDAAVQPLTAATLAGLGQVDQLLERGMKRATSLAIDGTDDVVLLALALFDDYAEEFEQLVREQRGPATLLKKAVLKAAEERQKDGGVR